MLVALALSPMLRTLPPNSVETFIEAVFDEKAISRLSRQRQRQPSRTSI